MRQAAFDVLGDAPFNATDRTFMLDAVNRAQKSLKRKGYSLSVTDIKAILFGITKRGYMANSAQDKRQTSATKKQRKKSPLAMPVDQGSSLFVGITPEQHEKIVGQLRAEFLAKRNSSSQKESYSREPEEEAAARLYERLISALPNDTEPQEKEASALSASTTQDRQEAPSQEAPMDLDSGGEQRRDGSQNPTTQG